MGLDSAERKALKKAAGYKAVDDHVQSGMIIGLGTGSTSFYAVERVGLKLKSGELKNIKAVPTSIRTQTQAEELGIPITSLDEYHELDVAIDGADTVDQLANCVKGGGGALLREKMVEAAAKKFVVIVDESKLADSLGPHFPVPVEMVQFCFNHILHRVLQLPSVKGCRGKQRMLEDGEPYVTDNGNFIADLHFEEPIQDPNRAAQELSSTVGVVEHGLFLRMADEVLVAGQDGIQVRRRGCETVVDEEATDRAVKKLRQS